MRSVAALCVHTCQVLPAALQAMQLLLPLRRAAGRPASQLHAMLDRGLLKLAKTVGNILNAHPWRVPCSHTPSMVSPHMGAFPPASSACRQVETSKKALLFHTL